MLVYFGLGLFLTGKLGPASRLIGQIANSMLNAYNISPVRYKVNPLLYLYIYVYIVILAYQVVYLSCSSFRLPKTLRTI